jgi:hypothetical protein
MHRSRSLLSGAIMGVVSYLFLAVWMGGDRNFALVMSTIVGVAIFSVVGTGKDVRGAAADAAWQAAAPDLPPQSERAALERSQTHIPAPEAPERVAARPAGRARRPAKASTRR